MVDELTPARKLFNECQRPMLNKLLDGFDGKLNSSKWATIAKCSQDTALRDILDLLERGVLAKDPGGGRAVDHEVELSAGLSHCLGRFPILSSD